MKQIFQKKIFSCFSCLMVPTKMVQISFCLFLTIWLEIARLVLEQSLRSPYVYTVYLVELLACWTKDQQSSIDICANITPRRYNFKSWIPEGTQSCLLNGTNFFPLFYNYTSQQGLIYLLLNISQANSMDSQISNKFDPGEWPTSLTHKNDIWEWPTSLTRENDPRVWPTSLTHENNPRKWSRSLTNENDPREWPTSLTHENDPRVWPTRMTHENDPWDSRDPRDLAHSLNYTSPLIPDFMVKWNKN